MPSGLEELQLHVAGCEAIGTQGVQQLKSSCPSSLQQFRGTFKGTQLNRKLGEACRKSEIDIKWPFRAFKMGPNAWGAAAFSGFPFQIYLGCPLRNFRNVQELLNL